MMPLNLVLVRHGLSEGNVARKRSRKGDHGAFDTEFGKRHSSKWRLTDLGRKQARVAGDWIRENLSFPFHRRYTSSFVRARETAGYLGLPDGHWYVEMYLRERDWGGLSELSEEEKHRRYAAELASQDIDSFYWAPPNGESIAQLCLRVDRVLNTLHRECSDKNVIIVCHGEVMWAFRIRLERMLPEVFVELDRVDPPGEHIYNCQVMHYSRMNPEAGAELGAESGSIDAQYNWMRSICPWDLKRSVNDWRRIIRPAFSNEELIAQADAVPQLIND